MASAIILARENRAMINDIKEDIKDIKEKMEETFNHMSSRLPVWATILFTILGALVAGLVVALLK